MTRFWVVVVGDRKCFVRYDDLWKRFWWGRWA